MSLFRRQSKNLTAPLRVSLAISTEPCAGEFEPLERRIVIPTELMVPTWRQLFPAERMMVFAGRRTRSGTQVTSAVDVTEPRPSRVHVRSCPEKLTRCLLDLEGTGARFAAWVHSHPGTGPHATFPSETDRKQDEDLRRNFGEDIVGIIAVEDGWLRVFGAAAAERRVVLSWLGHGIEPIVGERDVYRLQLS